MNILIITDAWRPQINGVVRTLEAIIPELEEMGHSVKIASPQETRPTTFHLPFYPEIALEFFAHKHLKRTIKNFQPGAVHIATEGPLGWAARRICLKQNRPFTTAYHTRFPEYLASRVLPLAPERGRGSKILDLRSKSLDFAEPAPDLIRGEGEPLLPKRIAKHIKNLTYAILRRFHAPSQAVLVATATMESELKQHGFKNTVLWPRGVDTNLFQPYGKTLSTYTNLPRPILLYVGRVAVEKNLPAFLDLKTTGSKVVIGDGPDLDKLRKQYPEAHFLGTLEGEMLARHFAAADLFVFPSKTDTFGLVLLEACACGLRIASYPAPGPVDIFTDPATRSFTVLNANLQRAVDEALSLPAISNIPRRFAESFSWNSCTDQFYQHLQAPTPKAVKRLTRMGEWLKR
jgi:glycosyltransferase involved in cell wall biosynthesis